MSNHKKDINVVHLKEALQLPNSIFEGKGRGQFKLSQQTPEMALFVISEKLLLPEEMYMSEEKLKLTFM